VKKDIRVRPGKGQSILGLVVGCIFVCIGIFIVVPTFGLFGLLWTGIAIAITAINGINAFSDKGIATSHIEIQEDHEEYKSSNSIEDRLKKVEDLYQKGYITKEEYEKKRSDILNDI
jgi:uncharacterized membrane protein